MLTINTGPRCPDRSWNEMRLIFLAHSRGEKRTSPPRATHVFATLIGSRSTGLVDEAEAITRIGIDYLEQKRKKALLVYSYRDAGTARHGTEKRTHGGSRQRKVIGSGIDLGGGGGGSMTWAQRTREASRESCASGLGIETRW